MYRMLAVGSGIAVEGLQKLLPVLATESLLSSLETIRLDSELTQDPSVTILIKGFIMFRKEVQIVNSC